MEENENSCSLLSGDVIVGYGTVTAVSAGQGICVSPGKGVCASYGPSPYSVIYGTPDPDFTIRQALAGHESDGSTDCCDEGVVHFFPEGSVSVHCNLPCNNALFLIAEGGDAVQSCDIAMKRLEEMKETIERMQRKVFELSLQQKVGK